MSLKSALFEIKEALGNNQNGEVEEGFIHDLESKVQLPSGTLVYYFNIFMLLKLKNQEGINQTHDNSKKINRKWVKSEIEFMFQYIKERQEEGSINITELLEEVAQLLNRGYQSVNYKYYTLVKEKEKNKKSLAKDYKFTTISQMEVPVISTEVIRDTRSASQMNVVNPSQDHDMLDILSGLITNVQQLPGINLNELLRSLFHLTNMALQNQESAQHLESIKSKATLEKETLLDKLNKKEQQLIQEKKRNDDLQSEVKKLAMEINAFNQLGDAAKIQNLKSYNQRLNYIIDSFGLVLQVGS